MNLTDFHSGYRAYSPNALKRIDFSRIHEAPIPFLVAKRKEPRA